MTTGVAGGWTTFGPILAIVLAPLIGYFAARRTSSGKIATSDAATLWHEASGLRDSYKADSELLRARLIALTEEAAALRVEIGALRSESRTMTQELGRLRAILEKEEPNS